MSTSDEKTLGGESLQADVALEQNRTLLLWAQRLQAISQSGTFFSRDPYDVERYEQIGQIASEMFESCFQIDHDRLKEAVEFNVGYATPKMDVRGVRRTRSYSLERGTITSGVFPGDG